MNNLEETANLKKMYTLATCMFVLRFYYSKHRTIKDFIIQGFISGVAGYMAGLFAPLFFDSQNAQHVFVGVSAFLANDFFIALIKIGQDYRSKPLQLFKDVGLIKGAPHDNDKEVDEEICDQSEGTDQKDSKKGDKKINTEGKDAIG